jgi:hypothetical protein
MRSGALLLILALAVPCSAQGQAKGRLRDVERFEVSGLPTSPTSELEKEIFLLLRIHKKGDLTDASRIHVKLAQYYKAQGQNTLADNCNRMAMEAWEAATGERPTSAGSPGSPPFDPLNTIAAIFSHTDDLKVEHTWEFFVDGTFAHSLTTASADASPGPRELGWYSIEGGRLRLWQMKPRFDRTVSFELLGDGGKDGAILDGARMKTVQ